MRRTVLATLLLLPACGEDNAPTPLTSNELDQLGQWILEGAAY